MIRWLSIAVLLAACGGKPAPPTVIKTNQPSPKIAPQLPACIAPSDVALRITDAIADGTRVRYCVRDNTTHCYALDVATGALERLSEPPKPPGDPTSPEDARVEMTTPELKVCQSETCKTLTRKVLPNAATIRGATNPEGTVAVFLLGDAAAGRGYAEVWDVAKAKKLSTFRYARGDFKCGEVSLLGEIIYIAANTCSAPGARGALYNARGRRIAYVGGRDFGVFGHAVTQLDGNTWAFLEENGRLLAIQDIAKGKVLKTIDTTALFRDVGAEMGNPGESAIVRMSDGKLAIIAGAPTTGSVATVDVTTGEVTVVRATPCT